MDDFVWAILALFMAFVSLTGSYLVIHQIFKRQDAMLAHHGPLINAIFWMCLMDFLFSIWVIILYTPQLWDDVIYEEGNSVRSTVCVILGFWGEFVTMASLSWYFMIAAMTFALLVGKSTETVRATVRLQHLYVWGTSAAGCFVLLGNNSLGADTQIDQGPPVECWLSKDQNTNGLFLYVPMTIYMFASLILLFYALHKARTFKSSKKVLRRMVLFVFGFILVWGIPLFDRFRLMITGDEPPEALAFIHWSCLCLSGFTNAVIWISTKPPPKKDILESSSSSEDETPVLPEETATEDRGSGSWSLPSQNSKIKTKKIRNIPPHVPIDGTLNGTTGLTTTDSFVLEEKALPGQRTPLKLNPREPLSGNRHHYSHSPAASPTGRSPARWDRRQRWSSDSVVVGENTPVSGPHLSDESNLREQLLKRDKRQHQQQRQQQRHRDSDGSRWNDSSERSRDQEERSREQEEIFPDSV